MKGNRRLIWTSAVLVIWFFMVAAEQGKKEKNNAISVNDKDYFISNEISRKPYTNKTIAKVEAILARNSSLPRLTRGEILEILENITKADEERLKATKVNNSEVSDEAVNTRQEKSLLVVLPFNPSNDTRGGLEVLYTKEPMTRLVFEGTTPSYSTYSKENLTSSDPGIPSSSSIATTATPTTSRPHKRRRKPMKPIVVMPQQEQRPVYVHNTKTSTTTQPPVETSEEQWKPYTAYSSAAVVTQKPPNIEIPLPESMKNTLAYLNLPKNHKPEGQAVYVTLPDRTDIYSSTTTKRPWKKSTKPKLTTTTPKPRTTKSPGSMPDISGAMDTLTSEMKDMLANLGLVPGRSNGGMNEPLQTIVTTPEPIQFRPINPTVDVSSYMSFKPLPVKGKNNDNNVMDKDMKQILSNFGLISPEHHRPIGYYNRMQKSLDLDEELGGTNTTSVEIINDSNDTSSEISSEKKTMTLTDINTDVLSDEMKDMLEDLGVIKNSKRRGGKVHIFNPVTQSALLDQPDHAERISKVLVDIKKLSEDNATHTLHPDDIRAQLENITSIVFTDDDNNNREDDLSYSQSENEADDDADHGVVYGTNGHFDGYEPDEEELLRIQGVQSNTFANNFNNFNVRWNNTETDEKPSKKLKEALSPPDPLSLEELHHAIEALNKNEVKRQQPESSSSETPASSSSEPDATTTPESPSSSTSETTTGSASTEASSSTTEEPTTTSSTTEAPPNIKDLEDSFGGETPLVRPNGLYFLLDWNSFLRVGQDNRTVNLQFSPKVGDPRNFIPVNVP